MNYYFLFKSLHLISVVSWMAGLLYLPRIFVYHAKVKPDIETSEIFKTMEYRLAYYIMTPAMIASWFFGLILIFYCARLDDFDEPMDALVYGVAVSLGFAAYENFEYVTSYFINDGANAAKSVLIHRSYTAIVLHSLCGVFMGFYLREAIFSKENHRLNLSHHHLLR